MTTVNAVKTADTTTVWWAFDPSCAGFAKSVKCPAGGAIAGNFCSISGVS